MRTLSYHEANCCLVPQYATTVQYRVQDFWIWTALVLYLLPLFVNFPCYLQALLAPFSSRITWSRSNSILTAFLNPCSRIKCYLCSGDIVATNTVGLGIYSFSIALVTLLRCGTQRDIVRPDKQKKEHSHSTRCTAWHLFVKKKNCNGHYEGRTRDLGVRSETSSY